MYSLMYYIPSMSGALAPMRLQNWSGLAWTRVRSRLQKFRTASFGEQHLEQSCI